MSREAQLEDALRAVYYDARAMAELLLRPKENPMAQHKVVIYKDEAGEWRWRREAANGEPVSNSGEGYKNLADCREMALAVNGGDFIEVQD